MLDLFEVIMMVIEMEELLDLLKDLSLNEKKTQTNNTLFILVIIQW